MTVTVPRLPLLLALCAACAPFRGTSADVPPLSGDRAMEHVKAQLAFGPRPPGSEALEKTRTYIEKQLTSYGLDVERDTFVSPTPYGQMKLTNLIARPKGADRNAIVLSSHYDCKRMDGIHFVGANDPGASAGLLIELARVLSAKQDGLDYWFVFFDAEEAFIEWSTFDSTYGSRHLAKRWKEDGTAARIKALILLDMIGDRDLDILRETNSTPWLMDLFFESARKGGYGDILSTYSAAIEDDHLPFLDRGFPAVDIIDLNYGPGNSFHHTAQDTIDKISAASMEKTGKAVLLFLGELQKRLRAG